MKTKKSSIKRVLGALFICILSSSSMAQYKLTKESFNILNLQAKGLETVQQEVTSGNYEKAAEALLSYYRNRKDIRHPLYNISDAKRFAGKKIAPKTLTLADNILKHKFKPHKGYPTFDYGKDINWQYRPVKDQILSTFLHRTAFWEPLGVVYRATQDEKYAKEWIFEVEDWIKKNKQGSFPDEKDYAWKAFVVSFRLYHWSGYFNLFLNSPNFTPSFLLEFLNSYYEQAEYVVNNYTDIGNHVLYESLHMMYAGTYFPEMKEATKWRKSGIEYLNREIKKQVFADGMQYELTPSYHIGAINTFLDGLRIAKLNRAVNEFPAEYKNLVEKMVLAIHKFSFPDYSYPLFGDSFISTKQKTLSLYKNWAKVFPENNTLAYFATEGESGKAPAYLSTYLPNGGIYSLRSGWDSNATSMVIKAGPPAFFHSHPDNGTFVLWVKGRDFTPDPGSFVYANVGGQENSKRDWYRSTAAHQTLTLDNKNITNDAKLIKWSTTGKMDVFTYKNPSYANLTHQRSFIFIDKKYFIIIDKAEGTANGKLGIHFNLKEDASPVIDKNQKSFHSSYSDGNNLLIKNLDGEETIMENEPSFVSYEYQKEIPRPGFVFEQHKSDGSAKVFVTLVFPYQGQTPPMISVSTNKGNDYVQGKINLTLTVDGKKTTIQTDISSSK